MMIENQREAVLHEEDIGNVLEVPAALTTLILDGLRV